MAAETSTSDTDNLGLRRRELFRMAALAAGAVGMAVGATEAMAAPAPVWTAAEMPRQAPAAEGVAELPGTRLWYWDTGGPGQAVVFLHAGTQSGAGWGYQQPVFAAAGFRAISYSRRGYYRSDAGNPADPGIASEDLDNLLKYLKVDKVHLVAIALGGFFALDYALVYPAKVRSLSIISSLMGIEPSEKDYADMNARIRPKAFDALPNEMKELHPSYRGGNPDGLAAWMKLEHEAIPGTRINQKRVYPLTWARLESIKHPTLLMTGDGDLYTPPALLRMEHQHMPHAEVSIVAEAGHCANWEQPAVFNQTVLAFVRKHMG